VARESVEMPALEARAVNKRFDGEPAIDRLSFSIESGEIFGVLGPNGAGKTTLIRMAMDVLTPDAGEISVLGSTDLGEVKERVGYLPEERGLYDSSPVKTNLRYLGRLKGLSKRAAEEVADRELDRVDMSQHTDSQVEKLSKGMAQKVQIASVLLHEPELIVLDEPFSGLDPVNTRLVKDLVLQLKNEGRTVVLSTHHMGQVERLCEGLLMLDDGEGVLYGDLDEAKSRFGSRKLRVEPVEAAENL